MRVRGVVTEAAADIAREVAERTLRREYVTGLEDGVSMTLEAALGREVEGGTPYPHPERHDAAFVKWAEEALANVEAHRRAAS